MNIRRSVENVTEKSAYLINDISTVHNLRELVYNRKITLVKEQLFLDIANSVCSDVNHPPMEIHACANEIYIITSSGVSTVYQSADGFDYVTSCAICLLFQDMYKNTYTASTATLSQIADDIEKGQWDVYLKMNPTFVGMLLTPSFNVNEIKDIPVENLPIETTDPQGKKTAILPVVGLILGALSIILFNSLFNFLFGVFGIIFGIIGLKTNTRRKIAIAAIVTSIIGIVLPLLISIIGVVSFFS